MCDQQELINQDGHVSSFEDHVFYKFCEQSDLQSLQKYVSSFDEKVINYKDHNGMTGFSLVCQKGDMKCLRMIQNVSHLDINTGDNEGNTPLILSIISGHSLVVTLLVNCFNKQLDLDKRNHFGFTALMKAAIHGRTKILQILLSAGANPSLRDPNRGLTAFEWAQFCDRKYCLKSFKEFENEKEPIQCFKRSKEKEKHINFNNGKWPEIEQSLRAYSSLIEAVEITSSLCACSPIISGLHKNSQYNKDKIIEKTKSIPQIIITSIESNDQ